MELTEVMNKTSEFGKGFIYNLILFAKHWANMREEIERLLKIEPKLHTTGWDLWFNGASDHFYELEIPKQWENKEIGKLAKWLQETSLRLGHGFDSENQATKKEFDEVFEKLEQLAILIDKELGIEPIKAEWN